VFVVVPPARAVVSLTTDGQHRDRRTVRSLVECVDTGIRRGGQTAPPLAGSTTAEKRVSRSGSGLASSAYAMVTAAATKDHLVPLRGSCFFDSADGRSRRCFQFIAFDTTIYSDISFLYF
jgi:hypothetical protein